MSFKKGDTVKIYVTDSSSDIYKYKNRTGIIIENAGEPWLWKVKLNDGYIQNFEDGEMKKLNNISKVKTHNRRMKK